MAARTLIILNNGDPNRVEMTEFSDAQEAQSYVEELLAAGTPQEQIRAFNAVELDMQVSHRPVVSFGGSAETSSQPVASGQVQASVDGAAAVDGSTEGAGEEETPMVRDGVRFSSLFKPDGGLEPA